MITGACAMLKCLESENVDVVFGYPGAVICPFYDELAKSKIKHVLVRQEQNAGHAASGYARVSGKVGVCIATSGPGATNLITALATSYVDSVPLVAITGQVESNLLGRDVFQEADITGSAEPFTKHSYLVKNANDIPRIFKEAFYIASTGRPGPVLIDIPIDIQEKLFNYKPFGDVNIRSYKPTYEGNIIQIKKIAKAINNSKRPLICVGGGVFLANAQKEAVKFAEKLNLSAVCTMMGFGVFELDNPKFFGMIGVHGNKTANTLLKQADCLIIIGARVCDRAIKNAYSTENGTVLAKDPQVIHIDVDPAEIGKNIKVDIPLVGDCKAVLNQLINYCNDKKENDWTNEFLNDNQFSKHSLQIEKPNSDFVSPKLFFNKINAFLCENAIVTLDVGQSLIWAMSNIKTKNARFLTSGGMGTMGYSLPCAIGAKIADYKRQVVAVCGDGAFQMCLMELATLVQFGVCVKIIVLKNNSLGLVREVQKLKYNCRYSQVDIGNIPDFKLIAKAYGIKSDSIANDFQIDEKLKLFFSSDESFVLECLINPDEKTI